MTIRQLMASVILAGATLLAGAAAQHAGAGKMVTLHGDGFTIQFPTTWKSDARVPLTQIFKHAALQKLAASAVAGVTADDLDGIIVFTQHASLTTAAIRQMEGSMFKDGAAAVVKAPTYSTQANGVVSGKQIRTLPYRGKNRTYGWAIVAQSSGGSTLYALLSVAQGNTADAQEVSTAMSTLR